MFTISKEPKSPLDPTVPVGTNTVSLSMETISSSSSVVFQNPVITEIVPFTNYYAAEEYHQNYYNLNSEEGYCKFLIQPKLEKFEKIFKNKIKH